MVSKIQSTTKLFFAKYLIIFILSAVYCTIQNETIPDDGDSPAPRKCVSTFINPMFRKRYDDTDSEESAPEDDLIEDFDPKTADWKYSPIYKGKGDAAVNVEAENEKNAAGSDNGDEESDDEESNDEDSSDKLGQIQDFADDVSKQN